MPDSKGWQLIRLNFGRNPVHFGEQGIGLEEINERVRSDTLFSALISSYARLYGKSQVESLLNKFLETPETPPFRVSSTFIYRRILREQWQLLYYLPKLLELPRKYPENDLEFTKTFKSFNYLPLSVWRRWYQGDGFTQDDCAQLVAKARKNESGYKGLLLDREGTFDYGKAFKVNQLPKVAIDRVTHATNFYHTGFIQYAWTERGSTASAASQLNDSSQTDSIVALSGLYFLMQFSAAHLESGDEETLPNKLQAALHLLGKEGIGGERSSGAGHFTAEWEDLPSEWEQVIHSSGNHYGLISVFWQNPLPPNWLSDSARYQLQERSGWVVSPFSGQQHRRKSLQMFTEGSVFSKLPHGRLADVTPRDRKGNLKFQVHSIYRNGIAMSLPVQVGDGG